MFANCHLGESRMKSLAFSLMVIALAGVVLAGCGYSEEEWQAQLDKYNRLVAQNQDTEGKLADVNKQLEKARNRIGKLENELERLGVDLNELNKDLANRSTQISKLSASLEEQQKALAEYKRRAAALERIKQRFERLRQPSCSQLTNLGLEVKIRNNRMIISLPGDVLFESGQGQAQDGRQRCARPRSPASSTATRHSAAATTRSPVTPTTWSSREASSSTIGACR